MNLAVCILLGAERVPASVGGEGIDLMVSLRIFEFL